MTRLSFILRAGLSTALLLVGGVAWAGFNEGNWSPNLVGPMAVLAVPALLSAPLAYVLAIHRYDRAVKGLKIGLGVLCALTLLAIVVLLQGNNFAVLLPMMGMGFLVPALVACFAGAAFARRRIAQMEGET